MISKDVADRRSLESISWSITVIGLYLISVCVFSLIYFLIYRKIKNSFVVNQIVEDFRRKEIVSGIMTLKELVRIGQEALLDLEVPRSESDRKAITHMEHFGKKFKMTITSFATDVGSAGHIEVLDENGEKKFGFGTSIGNFNTYDLWKLLDNHIKDSEVLLLSEQKRLGLEKEKLWSYFDFLYFSMITQTTIGYGDIIPHVPIARVMVMLQAFSTLILLTIAIDLY